MCPFPNLPISMPKTCNRTVPVPRNLLPPPPHAKGGRTFRPIQTSHKSPRNIYRFPTLGYKPWRSRLVTPGQRKFWAVAGTELRGSPHSRRNLAMSEPVKKGSHLTFPEEPLIVSDFRCRLEASTFTRSTEPSESSIANESKWSCHETTPAAQPRAHGGPTRHQHSVTCC